jgi:DNA polymerase III epsilon subunit-like protein
MAHLNGHCFAAVDIETTGFNPQVDEIVEIAVIILNNDLTPTTKIFNPIMRPDNLDLIDVDAARKIPILGTYYKEKLTDKSSLKTAGTVGLNPAIVPDLFLEWFESLELAPYKKLIPVGCNYPFDRSFLIQFLGSKTYNEIFVDLYRDVQVIANFFNDASDRRGFAADFAKVNLQYLCSCLKIEREGSAHTALSDAMVTAKIYKKLIALR